MISPECTKELIKLVADIHMDGYMCGSGSDKWLLAWAIAARRIANGDPFSQEMIVDIFRQESKLPTRADMETKQ